MTFKKLIKSVGSAAMYFGIYMAWQFVVVFAAMTGAELGLSFASIIDVANRLSVGGEYSFEEVLTEVLNSQLDVALGASAWVLEHTVQLTVAAGVFTLATYALMFILRKKKPLAEVGIAKMPIPAYFGMVLLGAQLNLAVAFLLPLIPFPDAWWEAYASQSDILLGARLWTLLLTVIVAPILEEIVFRGLIHTRLKRCMPTFAAMLISALTFGLMHGAIIAVIYASLLGLLLAWVFEKYESLLASILLHFGFNLCAIVLEGFEDVPAVVCIAAVVISIAGLIIVQMTAKGKVLAACEKKDSLPYEAEQNV